jgi:glycosyltransferase involved in cell wall biosynthesis
MVLSFIIPVFNGAAYLEQCLSSILVERIPDIEVLVINDASTDTTAEILREYASMDSRVRVFHQTENKLVGHCRNVGMKASRGDYLWFVDADDWLNPGSVSQILRILDQHPRAEVLSFGFAAHYSLKGGSSSILYKIPCQEHVEKAHILNFLKIRTGFSSMPFSYVYKKEFLLSQKIFFPEGIYFEDLYFTGKAFYFAKNVKLIQRIFYNYNRTNESSITLVQTKKKIYDLLENYNRLQLLFDREEECSGRYNNLLAFRFMMYGLPRCFRMFLCLPPKDRGDKSLRALLSKFRKSRLLALKSIGQAAYVARTLSSKDPLQRRVFRKNLRLLLLMKYASPLVELVAVIKAKM